MDAIGLILAGVALGCVVMDWANRLSLVRKLEAWQADSRIQLTQIADVHNGLITRMAEMQDQVNRHEFAFVGSKSASRIS